MNPDKTRFADGSMAMLQGEAGGPCGCISDPNVSRIFDQTAARYNDRSAFSNNAAMDNNNMLQSMFQAQAQNALEVTPGQYLTELAQLIKMAKT